MTATKMPTVTNVPERDERFYRVWNGELQTVFFREQSIVPGASVPSWAVWDTENRRLIRCSIDSYHATKKAAYQDELKQWQSSLVSQRNQLKRLKEDIKATQATIVNLKQMVENS